MSENRIKKAQSAPRFLSIRDVAADLKVSRGVVEGWLNRGLLSCYELPGSGKGGYRFRRIAETDLKVFLDKYYSGPKEPVKRAPKSGNLKLLPRDGNIER